MNPITFAAALFCTMGTWVALSIVMLNVLERVTWSPRIKTNLTLFVASVGAIFVCCVMLS